MNKAMWVCFGADVAYNITQFNLKLICKNILAI